MRAVRLTLGNSGDGMIKRHCKKIRLEINGGKYVCEIFSSGEIAFTNNTINMTPAWIEILAQKILSILE